ncbi:YciI family protein [Catenulispora yoronensis]|uniref:YciI family protein n=1 Tax=Catenulispora yoronensis TaxID=450799 RepID=A0ABN2U2M4_9ACTN
MAKYMVLIYGDEQRWDAISPEEMAEIDAGHRAFAQQAGPAVLASGQLESSATATTLRRGDGDGDTPSVTDGPFLETKEVVGGFYVLDAPDLDAVVKLTGLLAETRHDHSGVEITPLVHHG